METRNKMGREVQVQLMVSIVGPTLRELFANEHEVVVVVTRYN
jgi:hypothetical protein